MQIKQQTLFTLASITLLLSAAFVWRADATASRPPAQPTATAVIDIVDIIEGLNERVVLEAQLNTRMEARQELLNEVIQQLEQLKSDLDLLIPGTDAHREKLREGVELEALANARREAFSQIVSVDMGSVMAGLYNKIEAAIADISEREGYDIVLLDDSKFEIPNGAPQPDVYRAIVTKSVIYRHDGIDITQQVITLMNNEFGAP